MATQGQAILRPHSHPQAREAVQRLTDALVRAAARGERTPCSDPALRDHWTSERQQERAIAARWCGPCPVLGECRAAAEARGEKWYVHGGKDFSPRPYELKINTDGMSMQEHMSMQ
jgi:hypothetical protein